MAKIKRYAPVTYEAVVAWLETKPDMIEGITPRGCWGNAWRKFTRESTRSRNYPLFVEYVKRAGYDLRSIHSTENRNRFCLILPWRSLLDEIPAWKWGLCEASARDILVG